MSASTETAPASGGRPPSARLSPFARAAAAWRLTCERASHFWGTPAWRDVKTLTDRLLLIAVVGAVGWTAVNGVFVAHRAIANRGAAIVHLGGQPEVRVIPADGAAGAAGNPGTGTTGEDTVVKPVMPSGTVSGTHSEQIAISLVNDGPDGVVVKRAVLTGPYLTGSVNLNAGVGKVRNGYVGGGSSGTLIGTVTVDCDAASQVAQALVAGQSVPQQGATAVAITMDDTNGKAHQTVLTLDTTAMAVQGQVCTK